MELVMYFVLPVCVLHVQTISFYMMFNICQHYYRFWTYIRNIRIAERYKAQTANHDNKLIEELYTNGPVTRKLNRTWPQNIIYQ
jgi:hypothetical protein